MSGHQPGGCFHCGLPLDPGQPFTAVLDGEVRSFCCFGCQSVCQAIYDAGMEGFYQRTPDGTLLSPPPLPAKDTALFDLDEVQNEFVHEVGNAREIHLLVEGIHCAACVWLIERALSQLPGILSAQVNLAGRRLLLRWDNSQIKLSRILQRLGEIGYKAVPFDPEAAEGRIKKQNRALLFRLAFAGFAAMNLMWTSIALYAGAIEGEYRALFYWIGFALSTPTLLYSGWPFLKGAWISLKTRHPSMDLPIAIGATVTWGYSSWITFSGSTTGHVYFDTVVNFLFVILIGRHLEGMSKRSAVAATQRLLDLQPKVATLLEDGKERIVPIKAIKPGDQVLIRPGDKVPVDGLVIEGHSKLDEAMLTGESNPVSKHPGDRVSAGTLNSEGALTVEVTGTLQNTALGRIIRLVEEAQASKAPIQCTADKIVPWFVFATLFLATVTFLFWIGTDFEKALMAATSVLIITCPCAFGMSTPMSITVASGQGARHGILIKNGTVLETLSHIKHFVFDKTGTLTLGKMQVDQVIPSEDFDTATLISFAAAVERYSEHSIAKAIVAYGEELEAVQRQHLVKNFTSFAGHGIKADCDGRTLLLGTANWLHTQGVSLDSRLMRQSASLESKAIGCVHMAMDAQHAGIIAVTDHLRPDAKQLVARLRAEGMQLTLLSGDRTPVAQAIADELGGMDVIAEVLPEDKHRVIADLQKDGRLVAMVGDGVNDAPALIRADVGIAIGSGTDVSIESADIVLMGDELEKIHLATLLSQRTLRTIRQNISMSITYNLVMVPLAMAGFITPLIAAIAMPISSLAVIGNATRIRHLFKNARG